MENKHLVSIIVPVYQVEGYLVNCLESILAQTYTHLEIILVDDGSRDRSGEICDIYASRDERIRVVHKENGGLSDARNAGMAIAHGAYFFFVDGDDTVAPDAVESMLIALLKSDSDIAVCNMLRVFSDGTQKVFYRPTETLSVLDGLDRFKTLMQPSACNKLFAAELFHDLCFPVGKYYEDTFIYHVLAHRARRIVLTGKDSYCYWFRESSILGAPRFTDRYFDFVEAVYCRASYLLDHRIAFYGEQACESMYAAVHDAWHHIPRSGENQDRFRQIQRLYEKVFFRSFWRKGISWKQKVKMTSLLLFPRHQ